MEFPLPWVTLVLVEDFGMFIDHEVAYGKKVQRNKQGSFIKNKIRVFKTSIICCSGKVNKIVYTTREYLSIPN